jgi:hypothetical protein
LSYPLSQSTAATIQVTLYSDVDGVTPVAGLVPALQVQKANGAWASAAGSVTEVGSGDYNVSLAAGDTDTEGSLRIKVTATGALTLVERLRVRAAEPANVISWSGDQVADATNGYPTVDVIALRSSEESAIALASASAAGIATSGDVSSISLDTTTLAKEATLAAVKAKTDTLGALPASVSNPTVGGDELVFYRGDDYSGTRVATITVPSTYVHTDWTGAAMVMRVATAAVYAAGDGAGEQIGTVSHNCTTAGGTVSIALTAAETASLLGTDEGLNYVYQIVATTSTGKRETVSLGSLKVARDV